MATVKKTLRWGCLACHVIPDAGEADRKEIAATGKEHVRGFKHHVECTVREDGVEVRRYVVGPESTHILTVT